MNFAQAPRLAAASGVERVLPRPELLPLALHSHHRARVRARQERPEGAEPPPLKDAQEPPDAAPRRLPSGKSALLASTPDTAKPLQLLSSANPRMDIKAIFRIMDYTIVTRYLSGEA